MNVFDMFHERESEFTVAEAQQARDHEIDVSESTLMNRMQVILAEKRTSLSVLRTGIVLLTLPMTIVAFLITTSSFWDAMSNLIYLIPLFTLNTFLAVLGLTLIGRAWRRIRNYDRAIELIKEHSKKLGHFVP